MRNGRDRETVKECCCALSARRIYGKLCIVLCICLAIDPLANSQSQLRRAMSSQQNHHHEADWNWKFQGCLKMLHSLIVWTGVHSEGWSLKQKASSPILISRFTRTPPSKFVITRQANLMLTTNHTYVLPPWIVEALSRGIIFIIPNQVCTR